MTDSRIGALFKAKTREDGDCLIWTGAQIKGYGALHHQRRVVYAHRFAWEREHGPIPEGMHVDHVCHTPACVNPDHLRLATPSQNIGHRSGAQTNSGSGVRGVSWDASRSKWVAQVRAGGKDVLRRRYATLAEAAQAVAEARAEAFGDYAGNN